MGSLFDGSGGFPLAASMCGMEPVWASEIEPYPIAVSRTHFPRMKHLGNICNVRGDEIEPVDVISSGSPCTNLSVAGNRTGLAGKQSSLFHEAIRIIKEMRCATHNEYPKYVIWENVPGAFSSNQGRDFRVVLEEFIRIVQPEAAVPAMGGGGGGPKPTPMWVTDGALVTALLTLNTGESPSGAVESTLSCLLETNVPMKYVLSAKACIGILRRANRRGRELPAVLQTALEQTIKRAAL